MTFWWILCALLTTGPTSGKAEPATGQDLVSFPLASSPLSPDLGLVREPRALVLTRDGAPVDRLALPEKPALAKRKDDLAVLALGVHGLWIVRLDPKGKLIVLTRHRLPRPVDGFLLEAGRVIPTSAGEPILRPPPPIRPTRPARDLDVVPFPARLQALSPAVRARLKTWPGPRDLGPPVSSRPTAYLESSFLLTYFLPAWTRDLDLGPRAELTVLRVGFHLTPDHVVGIGLWANYRYDSIDVSSNEKLDSSVTDRRYLLGDYYVTFPFYRYSMPSRRFEFQAEPLRAVLKDVRKDVWEDVPETAWGVRLSAAWVKRAGPFRIGVEGRVDLFTRLLLPSVSLILGLNF